jgi:hypothetical protein
MNARGLGFVLLVAMAASCGEKAGSVAPPLTTVRMDFARTEGFFAAPFPSDELADVGGKVSLAGFPNEPGNGMVKQATAVIQRDARGFSTTAGIFFTLTGAIDPASLPDRKGSVAADASVALIDIDASSPNHLQRTIVDASYVDDGGEYADVRLLSLVPLQGTPLRPKTRYAAVVTTRVRDAHGAALGQAAAVAQLALGESPAGLRADVGLEYGAALTSVAMAGVPTDSVAALAVFTTGEPTAQLYGVNAAMAARAVPTIAKPFTRTETYDGYCVYATTIAMPDYQAGTPPFENEHDGGSWIFDASGAPIWQRDEPANFYVTIPRATIPVAGAPVVVFVRTGGGGDRPLIDRGVQAVHGGPAIVAGSGPAMDFAAVGFAGAQVDGPLGGLRNTTGKDEQFLVFNVGNAGALRDNVRESAAELAQLPRILEGMTIDVADCPGASSAAGGTRVGFDLDHLAIMGHSMGASIAPLVLAAQPRFGAMILSGAGASWIENVLYKKEPLDVAGAMNVLLGYVNDAPLREVTRGDPAVSLFQWAAEAADEQIYDDRILFVPSGSGPLGGAPRARHVLMLQGIVDHYIMPPIAEATALSMGLDLAGPAYDTSTPEIAGLPKMGEVIELVRARKPIALPAAGNVSSGAARATGVVVQHPADGIEDGHEVVFQTEAPKHQYRCFLASFLKGVPTVVQGGKELDACP